jgi:nicotinamidase-related amidase
MPAIHEGELIVPRAVLMAQAARILGIPVLGTEQNPQGLGPNGDAIRAACQTTLSKTHFDACEDGLLELLAQVRQTAPLAHQPAGRQVDQPTAPANNPALTQAITQVVLAGCEAHVCLLQTALGLLRAGLRVWVVANACGSRRASDHAAAMQRLAQAGATLVTHEMVLFEWLHDCRHPRFREVLGLIKAAG